MDRSAYSVFKEPHIVYGLVRSARGNVGGEVNIFG